MSNKIQKFFDLVNSTQLDKLASDSKFVQRSSAKLRGKAYLGILLQICLTGIDSSLNKMCLLLEKEFGIKMTTEGLNKRFNNFSTAFVFSTLTHLMSLRTSIVEEQTINELKGCFKGIYVADSTGFKLPDSMISEFPGVGGSVKSQAKIHFEYDLLTNEIITTSINPGTANDSSLMQDSGFVPGVLYLFDLGYSKKERFHTLAKEGAFLLTRQKRGVAFWLEDELLHEQILRKRCERLKKPFKKGLGIQLIDLIKYLRVRQGATKIIHIYLYPPSSKKESIVFYLHLTKLPPAARAKKLAQLAEQYRKKQPCKTATKRAEDKLMCSFNTYITNLDETIIPKGKAQTIYALRWQIELVFKSWKTHFRIDEINKCSPARLKTMIGAFLIAAWLIGVMAHQADRIVQRMMPKKKNGGGKEDRPAAISYFKSCGLVMLYWEELIRKCFKNKPKKVKETTNVIINSLVLYAKKDYKKIKKAA